MEKIKPVTKNWEDWKNSKNTAALVKKVKHKLNSMRKKSAKRRPLGIAGINWYGCELFFRLVGVMGNSIPCREGMDFVVQYICKPICEKDQCQLVDLFDGIMINGASVVAEMNCFHSYTWKQPLQDTLRSLRGGGIVSETELTKSYLWWDLFCQNQHIVEDVIGTFDKAVRQCEKLVMTVPEPSNPVALQRVWCLFEVMSAVTLKKDVVIYCNPHAKLLDIGQEVNIRTASATVPEDKDMILGLVEERVEGGLDGLNKIVGDVLLEGMGKARMTRNMATAMVGKNVEEEIEVKLGDYELKRRILDAGYSAVQLLGKDRDRLIKFARKNGIDLSGEANTELEKQARQMHRMNRGKRAIHHNTFDI
mmetsp:Transcript_11314/g.13706  ORF Transcript_11314/g.13706 Transcript_11314/m.13706 type:complete len:364 (+) Transcript_11314:56-1147(+)